VVTATKLNALGTPTATISGIVNSDIDAAAAIAASKLALTGAIGAAQLASNAVETAKINDGAVTAAKISSGAVETAKINSAAVTASKIDGVAKNGSGTNLTVGDAPIFGCRAWVNFDGTKDTTGAASTANTNRLIRASGNVTSVLRNAAGDYTITFTTAMPDANYAVVGSNQTSGAAVSTVGSVGIKVGTTPTTTTVNIVTGTYNQTAESPIASVAIIR